jgi:DNA transposition AAA+ family ATPase
MDAMTFIEIIIIAILVIVGLIILVVSASILALAKVLDQEHRMYQNKAVDNSIETVQKIRERCYERTRTDNSD